jgi:pilus assembly protein Flp/PilA
MAALGKARMMGGKLQAERLMKTFISRFPRDESGATAIEYGLIAAGISIVILAAVNTIGASLVSTFQEVTTILQ